MKVCSIVKVSYNDCHRSPVRRADTISDIIKASLVACDEDDIVPTAGHTIRVNCSDT